MLDRLIRSSVYETIIAMVSVIIVLLFVNLTASAQTTSQWFTVGKESGTFTLPKGTTVRWGSPASVYATDYGVHKTGDASPEAWTTPKVLDADTTFTANAAFFGSDPVYGVYKVVQVLQTYIVQIIHYKSPGASDFSEIDVPALPPPGPMNKDGATLSTSWSGDPLPCWSKTVTAKNPDGTEGKSYIMQICGPIN